MEEEKNKEEEIQEPKPMMRVRDGVDEKTGRQKYKLVECRSKASGKKRKLLNKGKHRRFRLHKPSELPDDKAVIYANIIIKHELEEDCSEVHLVNKVNRFLNKNPRIRRRYFKK